MTLFHTLFLPLFLFLSLSLSLSYIYIYIYIMAPTVLGKAKHICVCSSNYDQYILWALRVLLNRKCFRLAMQVHLFNRLLRFGT